MSNEFITCPYCEKSIPLSKAISHEVDTRLHKELDLREDAIKRKYESDLSAALQKARRDAFAAGSSEMSVELEVLKSQLSEQAAKLSQAQALEIKLRQERQSLEAEKAEVELRVIREIDAKRKEIEANTRRKAADEQTLILREKDELLGQMRKQIRDLKQKSEQGSQQLQGEVQELDLEERLRAMFPLDEIKFVPKGINGADLIQRVLDRTGELCGSMLWETKRTKNWSDAWVGKLKVDQLAVEADVALLLTQALPKDCERFKQVDGSLWVTNQACALDLAFVLRNALIELAKNRRLIRGKSGKMEVLYDYLSSAQFGARVDAILNTLSLMKKDLDAEKRAYSRIWAKRETQIEAVSSSVAHFVGDLETIGDLTFAEIKSLSLTTPSELETGLAIHEVTISALKVRSHER
jgi:hypothetical protein